MSGQDGGAVPRGYLVAGGLVAAGLLAVLLVPDSDVPSSSVNLVSRLLRDAGAPGWLATPSLWEKVMNVVLFVPVGAVVALLRPRWSVLLVTAAGGAASFAFELVQAYLLAGRDGSLVDVVTNTLGTFVGAVAVWTLRRSARRPQA